MGAIALAVCLLTVVACAAQAADTGLLTPLDTSSPRATLQGFIKTVDDVYAGFTDLLNEYNRSNRLYVSSEEFHRQIGLLRRAQKAAEALDTSGIAPVLQSTMPIERAIQLKEILDRIDLPAPEDVPGADMNARTPLTRWRLPGTEIDFVRIPDGPRAGEYLISAATLDRLPEFYDRVAGLPYKPGPAKQLHDVFLAMNSSAPDTIYDAFLQSPAGLGLLVPTRWLLDLPRWANVPVVGLTSWQWLGLTVGLLLGATIIRASHRLTRRLADRGPDEPDVYWRALPVPLGVILVATILVPLLCKLLHIGGTARVIIDFLQTIAFAVSAAWLSILVLIIAADLIVSSEHLKRSALDSQLIRLGARLIGVICAIIILIRGADELGIPAYSVIAGLGVGGLAVALAARDSIANLLGSLLIMIEKPFRIGQYIKVGGTEGTVENVGFRSTRIRTLDSSLISIPNSTVVNATVENVSIRPMRRQRFYVQLTYDASREKIEALTDSIRHLILDHPLTSKTNYQVRLNNLGESSLDILVMFYLEVQDNGPELREREAILLQIMDIVNELGLSFAFPTRTLQIEAATSEAKIVPLKLRS